MFCSKEAMLGTSKSISGFDPRSIVGCSLWLDAADASTVTGTTTVTAWNDKSGSGNNAGFDTNKPSYIPSNYIETSNNNTHIRLPVAAFTNTTNQTCIMFIVYADKQTGTNNQGLFSTLDYGLYQLLRSSYAIRGNIAVSDSNYTTFRNRLATTNTVLYSIQYTVGVIGSSNYVVSAYGNSWIASSANNYQEVTGDVYLGGIASFDVLGDIHANLKIYEVLVYNNVVLSTTQRQSVEGYLAWKWGLHVQVPAPVQTPLSISGCALWLDASDTTTLTLSTNNVTQWSDKSGSGNNATQATAGSQPTTGGSQNGLNTLLFTGKTMTYPTISLSAQTVFCVYLNNTFTPYGEPVAVGPFAFFYAAPSSNVGIGRTGVTDEVLANWSTNGLTTSKYTVYGGTVSVSGSTTSVLYFNGNQVASNTVTSSGGASYYRIGHYNGGTTGYIAEVVVFNSVLGTAQRQSVENYLMGKWGIKPSLPAIHPFYSLPAFSRPFGPLDIPGCALWLDAADQSSMTFSSGNSVNLWRDKSGNNNNASQSTTANQPSTYTSANGLTGMNFSLSNYFRGSFSSPITGNKLSAFVILNMNSSTYNYGRALSLSTLINNDFISGAGGTNISRNSSNVSLWQEAFGNGAATVGPFSIDTSTTYLVDSMFDGTTHTGYLNGTSVGSAAISSNFSIYLFGIGFQAYQLVSSSSDYWVGYINEVIVYSDALSTTQRQQIEGYLAAKWGLLNNLPGKTLSPLNIPGCALWLDASDLNSITFTTTTPPLAYFPFDGSIVDQSNVITFTTTGSVPYVTGKYGQALSFVNAQGAVSSNYLSSTYNLPSTFTIACWVQLPVTSGKYTFITTGPNSGYSLGNINFYVYAGNMYCSYNHIANNGAGYPVSANTWYHAAITYNSGTLLLYVNGAQSGSAVTAAGSTINGITIGGGADIGPDPYPVTGYVDDLRIYNSVLTAAQISNIYTNTQTSNVVLWKDKSGNGNNGTSIGNAESTVWSSNGMGGYPAIAFDGATGSFSGTIASNTGSTLSMFAVAFMNLGTSVNVYPRIISLAASGSQDWNLPTSTFLGRNGGGGVTQSVVTYRNGSVISYQPITYGTPFAASSVYTGSSNTTYANGTTAGAGASSGNFNYNVYNIGRIAGGAGFNTDSTLLGSVSEVLVYNTALTDSQRQSVENYLMSKWGISNVTSHPFKSIPPSTSQPPQFQEVTPGNWKYDWQPYLSNLAAANSGATASIGTSITPSVKCGFAATLAPNGNLYSYGWDVTGITVVNTTTNTIVTTITGTTTYAYFSSCLGPDGNVYCPPYCAATVCVIYPATNTFSTSAITMLSTPNSTLPNGSYCGSVLGPNGKIYCIPRAYAISCSIGIIDTVAKTFNIMPNAVVAANQGYIGGVLAPNGKIYCIPFVDSGSVSVGIIDPATDTFTTMPSSSVSTVGAYNGGVLAPNGKIYCIPYNATNVGIIDPVANTFNTTTITNAPGSAAYTGGCLGPNGKIYFAPRSRTAFGFVDPVANTLTTTGGVSGTSGSGYSGAFLTPGGKFYCPNVDSAVVNVVNFSSLSQTPSLNYCLSSYTNKS